MDNLGFQRMRVVTWCIVLMGLLVGMSSCRKSFKIKAADGTNGGVESWSQYGGLPQRINFRAHRLSPPLEQKWLYKASSAIEKSLLAVDGVVYLCTKDGRIEAVDIVTGRRVARKKAPETLSAACAYVGGYLVVATRYGEETLSLYDLRSGKKVWHVDAGDVETEPLVTPDAVYIAALYNHIDKYELETGEKIWNFSTEAQLHSSPAMRDDIVVVGSDDGTVYGLNAEKGNLIWKMKTGAVIYATPVIFGNTVFVASTDSVFYALNLTNGDLRWQFHAGHPLYQSAATDGWRVMFGASDGYFYCLDAHTGDVQWRFRAGSVISTSALLTEQHVYFGSLDHHYYGLDARTGEEVWRFETKGRVRTAPIMWDHYLIGASEDRFLYIFEASAAGSAGAW